VTRKKLKYIKFLSLYPEFLLDGYKEVEIVAFRWVHNPLEKNDFLPLNLVSDPPQRLLDETDKLYLGYGLSLFDDLNKSIEKYKSFYRKQRTHLKAHFVKDKGDSVAKLQLTKQDGVANTPNKSGHFTFYEYEGVELSDKVKCLTCIIDPDGKFVEI
jgi:hypothetical protein